MQADARTLAELGVTPSATGDWPLASLLDHSRSRGSRRALGRLLAMPLDSVDEIRRRQRALASLPHVLSAVHMESLLALASSVGDYLASNRVHVPAGRVERTAFRIRHPDLVALTEQGIDETSALLETMAALHPRLVAVGGDRAFSRMAAAVARVVEGEVLESLRAMRVGSLKPSRARVALDGWLRGTMRLPLEALVAAVYDLDALASLATTSSTPGFAVPEVTEGASLMLSDVWHPLLPGGARSDVVLADGERVLFLTGPNMAGKSTMLRALGIVVAFAHLGLAVPAASAVVPLSDRLFSSLRVEDNLARGESLYLAEVRRVGAVVRAVSAEERVVALLDEAFRGTNVLDASEAMALLVDGLSAAPAGVFVMASHLAEVGHARVGARGVAVAHMAAESEAEGPRFTYRMRRGVSDVRLGMQLLEREGVAAELRALIDTNAAGAMA